MNKICVGIDISKLTFDIAMHCQEGEITQVFQNSPVGYRKLLKMIPPQSHCVMEATGPYYLKLAKFLYAHGIQVSVENPLVIKRFMQMKLQRTKTDKADAKVIADYGEKMMPSLWQPPASWVILLQQKQSAIELLEKQIQMLKNQIEAFSHSIVNEKSPVTVLEQLIADMSDSKKRLEQEVEAKLKEEYKEMYQNLLTISSLGPKAVTNLMIVTQAFEKFQSSKQLQAYVGFCPRIFRSGTSIRGKGSICKLGTSHLRKVLYMCALTAVKYNFQCKEMYERLVKAGKAKKVALVAVANKLLRQAFKIAKSGNQYNQAFGSPLAK